MTPTAQDDEKVAIMQVVAKESIAFWDKDFEVWASCWVQEPYVRLAGWWAQGGVTVIEGWEELSGRMKELMETNPEPNPTAAQVRRENINLLIKGDMAWLTFDQYGEDTGDLIMDMPGLSRETRVLERQNNEWKIIYVNWLL
ncbi:MAG: nuclear transport factor 2 family protein, partial [Anaerolineales bacterium]|nr:nuclear transport factor 2 family protein [Anaerolineales bacterium]